MNAHLNHLAFLSTLASFPAWSFILFSNSQFRLKLMKCHHAIAFPKGQIIKITRMSSIQKFKKKRGEKKIAKILTSLHLTTRWNAYFAQFLSFFLFILSISLYNVYISSWVVQRDRIIFCLKEILMWEILWNDFQEQKH